MNDLSIEVRNLSKKYGKTKAINDLSFSIHAGEIVGFLGPNGAGKSTTMRILAGLSSATSGTASINQVSIARYPEKTKEMLGYMPENNPLPEDVRVIEYLRHRAKIKEIDPKQQKNRIETVMDICELSRSAERKIIGNLSKGFRQRVGIADCLLAKPKVIIMDEPTIGLDPHQILSIRKLIDSLRGKMTVLLSSHILPEIESCCDRVIIINRGHIVAEGTQAALKKAFTPFCTYKISAIAEMDALEHELYKLDARLEIVSKNENKDTAFSTICIKTDHDCSFGEKVSSLIKNHPEWELREISRQDPSLEDVFIAATRPNWSGELKSVDPMN